MKLSRKEEIEIIIKYLKQDVINTSKEHGCLLADTIVKNGKAIECYTNELKSINK